MIMETENKTQTKSVETQSRFNMEAENDYEFYRISEERFLEIGSKLSSIFWKYTRKDDYKLKQAISDALEIPQTEQDKDKRELEIAFVMGKFESMKELIHQRNGKKSII